MTLGTGNTPINVKLDTRTRLQSHMKFNDTYDKIINELLDNFEKRLKK